MYGGERELRVKPWEKTWVRAESDTRMLKSGGERKSRFGFWVVTESPWNAVLAYESQLVGNGNIDVCISALFLSLYL